MVGLIYALQDMLVPELQLNKIAEPVEFVSKQEEDEVLYIALVPTSISAQRTWQHLRHSFWSVGVRSRPGCNVEVVCWIRDSLQCCHAEPLRCICGSVRHRWLQAYASQHHVGVVIHWSFELPGPRFTSLQHSNRIRSHRTRSMSHLLHLLSVKTQTDRISQQARSCVPCVCETS